MLNLMIVELKPENETQILGEYSPPTQNKAKYGLRGPDVFLPLCLLLFVNPFLLHSAIFIDLHGSSQD